MGKRRKLSFNELEMRFNERMAIAVQRGYFPRMWGTRVAIGGKEHGHVSTVEVAGHVDSYGGVDPVGAYFAGGPVEKDPYNTAGAYETIACLTGRKWSEIYVVCWAFAGETVRNLKLLPFYKMGQRLAARWLPVPEVPVVIAAKAGEPTPTPVDPPLVLATT